MDTVLTGKKKKVQAFVRFGGMGARGNDLLPAASVRNFYCENGALKTVCVTPMSLDNGETAHCTLSGLIAVRRMKQYDEVEKTHASRFCVTTEAGAVHLQTLAETNNYSRLKSDVGMAALTVFADRNFHYWAGAFGANSSVLIDDKFTPIVLAVEKPSGAGCYFKHRLFVAKKPASLAYSAVDDLTDFTDSLSEGGEIGFPEAGGKIVAIQPFKDCLYVFFEYGIMRLDVNDLPESFSAEKIEYRRGKIFGRTVCAKENAILFMAEDGLYRLDGRNVKEVCRGAVKLPYGETKAEGAAVWDNRALIRYAVSDGVYETLCVNGDEGDCFYLDDTQALSQEEGGVAIFRGGLYTIFRLSEKGEVFNDEAILHTCETDFGTAKRKLLTKLTFTGSGSFYLTICNGSRKSRKWICFENGYAELRLNERGERFAFTVETDVLTEIEGMSVEMRVPV